MTEPSRLLLPLELRLPLFLERPHAFLQILALANRIQQPAHVGNCLERPLWHGLFREPLKRLYDKRRIARNFCRHLLCDRKMLPLQREAIYEADLVGTLGG